MKAQTFVISDRNYKMEPTARLLQVIAKIHGSKLKDDGIYVVGVSIHEVAVIKLEMQTDASPEKAEEQIANALKGLGFKLLDVSSEAGACPKCAKTGLLIFLNADGTCPGKESHREGA